MNDVLQPQVRPRRLRDVERGPRVARLGADVQEQRAVGPQHARGRRNPGVGPGQIVGLRQRVLVAAVLDAEVIGRRRDDDVDALGRELAEHFQAVGEVEAARRVAAATSGVGFQKNRHGRVAFGRNGSGVQRGGTRPAADESGSVTGRFRTRGRSAAADAKAVGDDGVVAAMPMAAAALTFFLHVSDFAARRQLAITANDAAARQSGESEKPNETHRRSSACDARAIPGTERSRSLPKPSRTFGTYRHKSSRLRVFQELPCRQYASRFAGIQIARNGTTFEPSSSAPVIRLRSYSGSSRSENRVATGVGPEYDWSRRAIRDFE